MMNDINIKGFPTIIVRDKNTGNIIIEKHLKNNATIRTKLLNSVLFGPPLSMFDNTGEFSVSSSRNGYHSPYDTVIGVSPVSMPKVSRMISIPSNYHGIFGSDNDSSRTYRGVQKLASGEDTIVQTTLQEGLDRIKNVSWKDGEFYIEFYGQLRAPESGTRTIKTILLGKNNGARGATYIENNSKILAAVSLDDEIIQDDTMIVDITYKLILPKYNEIIGNDAYNYVLRRYVEDLKIVKPGLNIDTPKMLHLNPLSYRVKGPDLITHTINYSLVSDKYNGIPFFKSDDYTGMHFSELKYNISNNSIFTDLSASFFLDKRINFGKNRFGGLYNGYMVLGDISFCKESQTRTSVDSQYSVNFLDKKDNIGTYSLSFPISPNIYSHHKALDGNDKPFLDIINYRKGMADMSVKINSYNSDTPEMYFVDITRGGEQGVARAKITKRPFFGAYNNNFEGGSYSLPHLSSDLSKLHSFINGTDCHYVSKKSMFKHKYGYEYQNGGDRHPLSDGHVLIVTRKGVLLSHIKIIDYEIYDKESTPQLPVRMITSIAHNYNTGDTFIGCAETGLYKLNKSLRNSNPATIEKIPGIEKVYTMNTDGYGNISIVTNQGLKITKNNCQSFETFDHTAMNSSEIISNEDFIKINTLATDFESENLNTMMIFSNKVKNKACLFFSKRKDGSEFDNLVGHTTRNAISNLTHFKNIDAWLQMFSMNKKANTFLRTPRFTDSILDVDFIKSSLHKDTKSNEGNNENTAIKMLESGNILPHRFITSKNSKFYLCICGMIYEFEFNNNNLIKIYNNFSQNYDDVKESISFCAITSRGNGSENGSLKSGSKFSQSILFLDDTPLTISGYYNGGYVTTTNYFDRVGNKYGDYLYNKISNRNNNIVSYSSLASDSPRKSSLESDVASLGPNDSFSNMNQDLNWAIWGGIIIDEFKDSGLALVTANSGTSSWENILSGDYIKSIPNYDDIFNLYMPTEDCINSGVVSLRASYLWNIRQPNGRRFGNSADIIDKEVKVNQAEDFLIPEGKLTIGDIDLFFDSKSSGNKAYVEGDYYSFVNYDGIVHDDSTSFSIANNMTISNITEDTYSQSGEISKSENSGHLTIRSQLIAGFGGELNDGTIFSTSGSIYVHFSKPKYVSIGGFKSTIDTSKIRGAGLYEFRGVSSGSSDYVLLKVWVGNYKGKKFVFPTTSTNTRSASVSLSDINRFTIEDDSILTIEFSPVDRSFVLKKDNVQLYSSGSMRNLGLPVIKISSYCYSLWESSSGVMIEQKHNLDEELNNFTTFLGPSVIPPMTFEYINRGYPIISVGDINGKTGIYDEKFAGLPFEDSVRSINIKIDKKDISLKVLSNGLSIFDNSGYVNDILSSMHNMTNDVYPTTLQSGQVAIFHDLGLIMFSQEDIGKKYSIDYRYYKDAIIGVDEFAEESDIPQDPE